MKNVFKVFGIIALVAVVGFSMVACDDDGGGGGSGPGGSGGGSGTFTLTGIPSQYNGKYAYLTAIDHEGLTLGGFQTINYTNTSYTLPRISNGRVSLPMWKFDSNLASVDISLLWQRYYGNDNVSQIAVGIFPSETANLDDKIGQINFLQGGKFSNGSSSKSWNDGIWVNR